ncbi:MAG TPA: pilus assembly protein PilP [Myxococcota bacterium]|nr:pilus assembly protein PilP [Myxococcota bacterium]HSA21668.1 pilus assembly protein PilP [Myxococcota bacterium]
MRRSRILPGFVAMVACALVLPALALAGDDYQALGKRDPFSSTYRPIVERPRDVAPADGPLARLDLAQLRLVAVVVGTGRSLAFVEAPDGVQHAVAPGTRLGRNGGKVERIGRGELVVVERVLGERGPRVVRTVLRLQAGPSAVDALRPAAQPWSALRR